MKNEKHIELDLNFPLKTPESISHFITEHSLGDKTILPMVFRFFGCVYAGSTCFTKPTAPEEIDFQDENAIYAIRNQ